MQRVKIFGLDDIRICYDIIRYKILQSVKRICDFFRKYNNRDVIQLTEQIIERYDLNKNLDMKDKIYLISPNFIEEKVKRIFEMHREIGFIARFGLLSGLRE